MPESVLRRCCTSRDYIYWLEAVAQLISLAVVARDQFDGIVCFVDNTAAEHALNKGTSKKSESLLVNRCLLGVGCPSGFVCQFSAGHQPGKPVRQGLKGRLFRGAPVRLQTFGAPVRDRVAASSSTAAGTCELAGVGLPGRGRQPVRRDTALQGGRGRAVSGFV